MTEMTMMERVARAILMSDGALVFAENDEIWCEQVRQFHAMCEKFPQYVNARSTLTDAFRRARSAIQAMREPTFHLRDAMNDVRVDGPAYVDMNLSIHDCGRLFTAGVDAALTESPRDAA